MANQERIDSIIDQAAIDKEIKYLKGNLIEIKEIITTMPATRARVEGANSVKELSKEQIKLAEGVKAVEGLMKQRFATEAKLITMETAYAKQTAVTREEIRKKNAELKTEAQLQAASAGSIDRARIKVKQLADERNKLNLFTKEGQQRQAELNTQIDKYNNFIKKNVDALSQQKINVGNYQGSAKIIVDALEKEIQKLKQLEAQRVRVANAGSSPIGFNQGANQAATVTAKANGDFSGFKLSANQATTELKKLDAQIEQSRTVVEGFRRVTDQPLFLKTAGQLGDANKELRFFTKALIDMERQGQGNSAAADQLRTHLAQLTDEIADAKAEVKALSSDTRGLDLFAGSVSFAADAMQTAAGAAVLFGASESEVQEQTRSLVAIMSVANGIKGIGNELTTRGTAANKAFAAAQALYATATDKSAAASVRFGAALKLAFPVAIVALITAIVLKLREYGKEQEELTKLSREVNDVRREGEKEAQKELVNLRLLYKASQDQNLALTERKKAVDQLQSQYPAYFKNMSDEQILAGKGAEAYDKLTQSIIANARAQAAKNKIIEISEEILEASLKVEEANQKISQAQGGVAVQDKIIPGQIAGTNAAALRISKDAKDIDSAVSAIKTKYSEYYQVVAKGNARIDALIKSIGLENFIDGKGSGASATIAKQQKIIDETGNQIYEQELQQAKQRVERNIETNQKLLSNEELSNKDRYTALVQYYHNRRKLIEIETAIEINAEKERIRKVTEALNAQKGEKGADIGAINNQIIKETAASAVVIQTIEDGAYSKRKTAADEFYNGIDGLRKKDQSLQLKDADRFKDFLARKVELEKEAQEKITQLQKDAADERKQIQKDLTQDLEELLTSFVASSYDRESQALEDKLALLDIEKERKIADVNLLGLTEEEKVKKIAAIEKNAAFQKEQIERKKIQLAKERRRIEKLADSAQIIGETVKSVLSLKAKAAEAKATAALLAANPLTAVYAPVALAAAATIATQIPIVIATGVASLARLAFFKHGKSKSNNYEGPAIVGDGYQHEPILRKDGTLELSPNKPTLTYIGKDDQVFPNIQALMMAMANKQIRDLPGMNIPKQNNQKLERIMSGVAKSLNEIKNKPVAHYQFDTDIRMKAFWQNEVKN